VHGVPGTTQLLRASFCLISRESGRVSATGLPHGADAATARGVEGGREKATGAGGGPVALVEGKTRRCRVYGDGWRRSPAPPLYVQPRIRAGFCQAIDEIPRVAVPHAGSVSSLPHSGAVDVPGAGPVTSPLGGLATPALQGLFKDEAGAVWLGAARTVTAATASAREPATRIKEGSS